MTANNCLQISVLLEIIFCSCVIETTLLSENGRFSKQTESDLTYLVDHKNVDQMIKQSLSKVEQNMLSVSCRTVICLRIWVWQIINLLTINHDILLNLVQ